MKLTETVEEEAAVEEDDDVKDNWDDEDEDDGVKDNWDASSEDEVEEGIFLIYFW